MALINFFAHSDDTSQARDGMLHALAFSTYWHARLRVSPGDDPSGLSLRQWLAKIGVELASNLLFGADDEQLEPMSARGWLDAVPQTPAELQSRISSSTVGQHTPPAIRVSSVELVSP